MTFSQNSLKMANDGILSRKISCTPCCGDFLTYVWRLGASPEEVDQRFRSNQIDKILSKEKHAIKRQVVVWVCFFLNIFFSSSYLVYYLSSILLLPTTYNLRAALVY